MAQILAPYVADMSFEGTGVVEHIDKPTYQINAIEYLYGLNVPAANDLFDAFEVADADPGVDGSANVLVTLDAKFKPALATAMAAAQGGKLGSAVDLATDSLTAATGSESLDVTMKAEVKTEIEAALNENSVVEFLEADSISMTLSVDWSAGAANMFTGLTAPLLKGMYLQIGNRAINGDADAGGPKTFSDILVTGDKLAFVFDVNGAIAVSESAISANPAAGAGATMTPGAGNAPALGVTGDWEGLSNGIAGLNVLTESRRVGFIFTVQ